MDVHYFLEEVKIMAGLAEFPEADKAPALAPGLYITATPIGNLKDITLRAVQTLQAADLVACEDTRVTAKLLAAIGARAKTVAYHEHSSERDRDRILAAVGDGKAVALVSDAGTPMISDPGYRLTRMARNMGLDVHTLPGPCAAIAGLTLSGLPTDRFLFAGFPPNKSAARQTWYGELARIDASLVIYESGRRLAASLSDAAAVLGDRDVSVSREISKKFEETRTGTLRGLADVYDGEEDPRGELVVVIGPPANTGMSDDMDLDDMLTKALAYLRTRDAAALVADITGASKRDLYQRALEMDAD